jgi:hypothetical protein
MLALLVAMLHVSFTAVSLPHLSLHEVMRGLIGFNMLALLVAVLHCMAMYVARARVQVVFVVTTLMSRACVMRGLKTINLVLRHKSQKELLLVRVCTSPDYLPHFISLHLTMAYNYECAPTRVEVPSPGSTTATTNAAVPIGSTHSSAQPMASYSPMGANDNVPEFNASHMSPIMADGVHDYSHCSAITANSEHDSQLLHPDMRRLEQYGHVHEVPRDAPNLVTGSTELPLPVAVPSLRVLSHHAYAPSGAEL